MNVHSASIYAEDWFWHERRIQTIIVSHSLDGLLERHNFVCLFQSFGVFYVYFMLARCDFVVGHLNVYPQLLKSGRHHCSNVSCKVSWREIKVSRRVMISPILLRSEQKELYLRSNMVKTSFLLCFLLDLSENMSRVAGKRSFVWIINVTHQPCNILPIPQPRKKNVG